MFYQLSNIQSSMILKKNNQLKTFIPTYFWCPRSWTFLLLGGFCTVLHGILPVFMGTAVRTRSGSGCLSHASPMRNRTHNLGVLSIGFQLLPVLASIGSGISGWFILWFRDQLSVHHVQRDQDLSECLPCTSRARADCTVLYNRIWYFLRFLKSDRFFPNRYIIMG